MPDASGYCDELVRLLPALDPHKDAYAAALRFMLVTLARREEVCGATWREVDVEQTTWTLPAERVKSGRSHIVPLSRQAVAS